MAYNRKQTSSILASKAAKILNNPNASKVAKSLAASTLSQSSTSKQTSSNMETKASNVLRSDKYSKDTKAFAASVLSQSNKER